MKTILSQDAANFPGGCYQIILNLAQPVSLAVARLGLLRFPPGFYIYTGSQQRSLLKRVERHLRPEKKIHWHIDYLTVHREFRVTYVLLYPGSDAECELHRSFQKMSGARELHPGFGSSDCRNKCTSHLLYLKTVAEEQLGKWLEQFPSAKLIRIEPGNAAMRF